MRIIDQWGITDIPYKKVCISIDEGAVIAFTANNLKFVLASYSSTDVAQKAMKKLYIAYQRFNRDPFRSVTGGEIEYFQFPPEEYL